jgi:hypothetical protein
MGCLGGRKDADAHLRHGAYHFLIAILLSHLFFLNANGVAMAAMSHPTYL